MSGIGFDEQSRMMPKTLTLVQFPRSAETKQYLLFLSKVYYQLLDCRVEITHLDPGRNFPIENLSAFPATTEATAGRLRRHVRKGRN